MLDRLLIEIRAAVGDPLRLLSSWKLSVVLMIVAALYYALLAIWARSTPAHVVGNIASLVPFWAVYVLTLLNTGFCLWRRWPNLLRELRRSPLSDRVPPRWQQPASEIVSERDARGLLRSMGYAARPGPEGGLRGVRRQWPVLGTFLFHGAFFLVATGFALSLAYRDEVKASVAVGEEYADAVRPTEAAATAPRADLSFRVDAIAPEFWRDQMLFTSLTADLTLDDGQRARTKINRPVWLDWSTFVRLSSFGYAPAYEIIDRQGRVREAGVVKMSVFPPGQRDHFSPQDLPHRIYVTVYPDAEARADGMVTGTLNLVHPLIRVQVLRGKLTLAEGLMEPGEELEFEGLRLRFPEIRYFGEFTILTDPGAPVLFLGFLLGLLGLLLRVRGKRAEVEWIPGPSGAGGELSGFGAAEPPAEAKGAAR